MTFFGVLMIGVMAFGPPLCLVKPWRYEEMMELWNAPPPPPVASDKAFVALGLRYGYLAWRCLVAFLLTT
ncbi:MAG TPA: hypothetical protein VNQ33_08895, partial [Acidimicrobiales bacterium]|nr:hypothetical protein [Acidimicrobiales bacterium]